jgi:hypothetical protein
VKDVVRALHLDRRKKVERGIGPDDGTPGDERSSGARRNVNRVGLSRPKVRSKGVERRRVEPEPVAGGVPASGGCQLRVMRHGLSDVVSHLVSGE